MFGEVYFIVITMLFTERYHETLAVASGSRRATWKAALGDDIFNFCLGPNFLAS